MILNSDDELDILDSVLARLEGPPTVGIGSNGRAVYADRSPYRPTRTPAEILRLIEKYIAKVVRMDDGNWAAVGPSGRACVGETLSIAVCKAIIEFR
ncbi:hypothetical protein [uncultured Nevskia sp.]|uniref:hypothetical protein n=1 Tax=uncultured Nevskia sp. TaxID=228950 RepID=UPI0025D0CEF1|nr:hypothetical protein [uncultured Nevskia sp.]